MPSARSSQVELFEIFQFTLNLSKAVPPREETTGASSLVALGALFDFSVPAQDRRRGVVLFVDLPADKASRYGQQISGILAQSSLPPGLAGKLAGRWDHAAAVALGRSGRAFAWPVRERAKETHASELTALLVAALRGFQVFMEARRPMPVFSDEVSRPAFLAFVDASRRDLPDGSQAYRLGGVLWGPGLARCFTLDVPVVATCLLPQHAGNAINEAEALAALVAVRHLESSAADSDLFVFIDSMAAEGVLIKGYSSSEQLTAITASFWASIRRGGAACWVGRVPSRLNVADGFSREDFQLQAKLGLAWAEVSIPRGDDIPWLRQQEQPARPACAAAAARKDRRRGKHQGLA